MISRYSCLLDLSESTNEKVAGQDFSVLDLTRQATVLLANAIDKIGDPFAIHGFCSDGRHDVEYYRYKDFEQPYTEIPKARLAGMTGQLSTRMGCRHTPCQSLPETAKILQETDCWSLPMANQRISMCVIHNICVMILKKR